MTKTNSKVIIVGAGFGGIALAKKLKNKSIDVVVIDQNNYHSFQPLLYQVATGGLEPESIAYPIRRILRGSKNIRFRMAKALNVDVAHQTLSTSIGKLYYDYLIIATGSTNNFFNFAPQKNMLLPLKTIADALDIRSFLMQNLEKALTTLNNTEQEEIVNVAIAGGGPAGLELAGALAEMKKYVLPRDYPELNFDHMQIHLFEAKSQLLANMSSKASAASLKFLTDLGVSVYLNTKVNSYDGHKVILDDGNQFLTDTLIWTAGVKGALIEGLPPEALMAGDRIIVNTFNKIITNDNIFVIGDVAACIDEDNPNGLSMLAPVAIQQGEKLAQNIILDISGKNMQPFVYKNNGAMATIGRKKAVVDLPGYKFQGAFAWFVWMFVHIISLVSFRNKLVTLIDWAQNYFSYDRPHALIIHKYKRKNQKAVLLKKPPNNS